MALLKDSTSQSVVVVLEYCPNYPHVGRITVWQLMPKSEIFFNTGKKLNWYIRTHLLQPKFSSFVSKFCLATSKQVYISSPSEDTEAERGVLLEERRVVRKHSHKLRSICSQKIHFIFFTISENSSIDKRGYLSDRGMVWDLPHDRYTPKLYRFYTLPCGKMNIILRQ